MSNKRKFACLVCSCLTLEKRDEFEICPVSFCKDDPTQSQNPQLAGGANGESLNEARSNYLNFGACSADMLEYVRKPVKRKLEGGSR